ncbi:MAG: SDR family oxidoreductase [Polyangiaceae bacterium]|nr:SDR family oxidoreductase [Polyangiaceae bacterium]
MSAEATAIHKSVVITGSTKGLGFELARSFLARGCGVTLSGRDEQALTRALATLRREHGIDRVAGISGDVTLRADVEALWARAAAVFGRVDVWINNAGTTNPQVPFADQDASDICAVVGTNLAGTMLGSWVAIRGMRAQGFGALYNMEGYGSDGSRQPGMSTYGSTKVAVRYLTRSLAAELRDTPIVVGALSPGVVVTDLLLDVYARGAPENWRRARRIFQFIADRTETVAPWLADAVLANQKTDVRLAWMTVPRAIARFFMPHYHRRKLLPE